MLSPLEKKRATYLSFFKDGVADGLLSGIIDDSKRSSAYYKQGYINMNKFIVLHILQTTPKKRSGFVYKIKEIYRKFFKTKERIW